MKDSARLQSAIEVLKTHEEQQKPLDQICHTYFKERRYIGSKDRQAISQYVYGVMRRRASCDWWALERGSSPLIMSPLEASRIRILAYLWLHEKMPREKFGILFSGEKYAPPMLNDNEKRLFVELPNFGKLDPWVQFEFPEWLYPYLNRRFGSQLPEEMEALLGQATLDLRVNTLSSTRDAALQELQKEGVQANITLLSPWCLRCEARVPIAQTQPFKEGWIEVQDEGSQLIVQLMDLKPGQAVLDLCAGAGGKTLAIAAQLENRGRIVATDTADWRLKRMKERLKRADVHNVESRPIAGIQDKWLKRQHNRFDRVLIDAPCSGTGTWRRNPDQKWNLKPVDLKELPILQLQLLEGGAKLVKPGGYLIYATCSLLCEENEDVINQFLIANPNFTVIPCGLEQEDFLSLSPYRNQTDGFFAGKLRREQS